MADVITVKVQGLAELNARLQRFPIDLQKRVIRKAVGAAAQVVKKAAIAAAPVARFPVKRGGGFVTPPGTLKAAGIVKFDRQDSNDQQAVYLITFRKGKKARSIGKKGVSKDAFYASWVEWGHKFVPRFKGKYTDYPLYGRKRRTRLAERRRSSTRRVEGKLFLTHAWEAKKDEALRVMTESIRSNFEKAIAP